MKLSKKMSKNPGKDSDILRRFFAVGALLWDIVLPVS